MAPKATLLTGKRDTSVSFREISNGWIVSRTIEKKNGEFEHVETYSEEKPVLEVK